MKSLADVEVVADDGTASICDIDDGRGRSLAHVNVLNANRRRLMNDDAADVDSDNGANDCGNCSSNCIPTILLLQLFLFIVLSLFIDFVCQTDNV